MNLDEYRDRMAAAHQQFQTDVLDLLRSYGQVQTVFTQTLAELGARFDALEESQDELKRLILEQGQTLREHRADLQALRERLNGR